MTPSPYVWLLLLAIALSLFTWRKSTPRDPRLITIYVAALAGAFLGATIIYPLPAVPLELLFNLIAAATLFTLRRQKILPGQHFHLYLMAYGLFRFAHEFARETPRLAGPFSGYALSALAVFLLGAIGFQKRREKK